MSEQIKEAVMADPVVQAAIADSGFVPDPVSAPQLATPATTVTRGRAEGQAGTMSPQKPNVMTSPEGKMVAAPTTTEEEDRATVGQRKINLIWETTQAAVALSVTIATLVVAARLAMQENPDTAAFLLLSNVFFLVVGTYFHRTNNTATGGVGKGYSGR